MTAFFVRTDQTIAGPLTGVELREAALAGILRFDGVVGGSPDGPWFRAADIGLFSEKRTPLPHPPDTYVPQYEVRGMPGAFQGPFKLRELIGFAARGMLPPEALLQSDNSEDWIEVRRYRILAAVLGGELVLLDESGKVVVRNVAAAPTGDQAVQTTARAPIELAAAADMTQATSQARPISDAAAPGDSEPWHGRPIDGWAGSSRDEPPEVRPPSRLRQQWSRLRDRMPAMQWAIPSRLAIQFVCLILVFVGVASAFTFWKQTGLNRDQVIGDWIVRRSDGQPAVGVSLRSNGECVIFNTRGHSWTGDFVWEQQSQNTSGMPNIAPFDTVVDQVSATHASGVVEPTDGFVRLRGYVKSSPEMDGHAVRDLFLRRIGDELRIGYLASVRWTEESKQMDAGWLTASPHDKVDVDIAQSLRKIETEFPVPVDDFGGELPLHISEAIDAVRSGIPTTVEGKQVKSHETLAYSGQVNAAYLLERFGLPDEARRIFRFEIPDRRSGPSFEGAQIVRYGELQFVLSENGQLRYLMLVPEQTF